MILVIPVSHVDIDQAALLAIRIASLGVLNSKIVVACSWRAWWDVEKISKHLLGAEVFVIKEENELGWPDSCNHMFYEVAKHMAFYHSSEPWYFMEADCWPLKEGWFDALSQEYKDAGKPYMGVKQNTVHLINGELIVVGKHMVGTGIYPADFLTRCKTIHFLMHEPWDVEIAKEVVPEMHHTNLIAHRWGTFGYQWKDGKLRPSGSKSPNPEHIRPVPSEAVLLHGVKDNSLLTLGL